MLVECEKCHCSYNDEYRSTICPHGQIGAGAQKYAYCRVHDLFNCPLHSDSPTKTDANGIIKKESLTAGQ